MNKLYDDNTLLSLGYYTIPIYIYNEENGVYIGSSTYVASEGDAAPKGSTYIAPGEDRAGFVRVFDHTNKKWSYQNYTNSRKAWSMVDGSEIAISGIGDTPTGYITEECPYPGGMAWNAGTNKWDYTQDGLRRKAEEIMASDVSPNLQLAQQMSVTLTPDYTNYASSIEKIAVGADTKSTTLPDRPSGSIS